MKNIIETMLAYSTKTIPAYVDDLAFYDDESHRLIVISSSDYKKHNFNNYTVISKTSELSDCSSIKLMNLNTFISRNPSSNIETYITSDHSSRVFANFDFYVSAYIHLYRTYKSFETLAEHNYTTLIDTFIDYCVSKNTDNPSTLCYFNYDIHKIFKLRKSVYEMFKDYLNNHNNYLYIYTNQKDYKFTDQQFRVLLKTLKIFSKSQHTVKERLAETFSELTDNEIA